MLKINSDVAGKQYVVSQLELWTELDPYSELLRLSFLKDITGEACWEKKLAVHLLTTRPVNADSVAGFITYTWGKALKNQIARESFIESLSYAHLPELVSLLGSEAQRYFPPLKPQPSNELIKRVALVAPYLSDKNHTPSQMIVQQSLVLKMLGYEVRIFSCQELIIPDMLCYTGSDEQVILSPLDINFWQFALPSGVGLVCGDVRYSLPARWQVISAAVTEFSPHVVLFCGLFSPFVTALFKNYPVVGLNVHALPVMASVDVWLSSDQSKRWNQDPLWVPFLSPACTHYHPYRIKTTVAQSMLKRKDIDISDDAVLWISIGWRLCDEIKDSWAQSMMALLNQLPHVVWILVGSNIPPALNCARSDQIKSLGYRNDVAELLLLSDIYVNPPRMGGGFTVAEAMATGLAVVSFSDSDGGDKVGSHAVSGNNDYLQRLTQLSVDGAQRLEMGQKLKERFSKTFDITNSGASMVQALETAVTLGKTRLYPKETTTE